MKAKNVNVPANCKIVKSEKGASGKFEILLNEKTRQYQWRIVSRNGYTVCSATGLNTVASCTKGMKATEKILWEILCVSR